MATKSSKLHDLVQISSLGNLPNEIIIEVLLRLPVKSICRFKCTSKPWKALLSSAKFAELHLARVLAGKTECLLFRLASADEPMVRNRGGESSNEPFKVFSLRSKETLEEFPVAQVSSNNKTSHYNIVDSCNGLVCLVEWNRAATVQYMNTSLWNPTTREFRNLPRNHVNWFTSKPTMVGLGYLFDPGSNDYLVVRISYLLEEKSYVVEIYSLRINRWKVIETTDMKSYYFERTISQVFMNQALHWLVLKGDKFTDAQSLVLSFDVKEEKFFEVQLPERDIITDVLLLHKTPLNGPTSSTEYLSLIVFNPFKAYESWVLKEYSNAESWVKLYSVRIKGDPMKPLHVLDNNRILMQRYNDGKVVVWDSKFRVKKEVRVYNRVHVVRHIESLVSPHLGTELASSGSRNVGIVVTTEDEEQLFSSSSIQLRAQ